MSESTATQTRGASRATRTAASPRRSPVRYIVLAVALVLALIAPFYVDEFWLRTGFAVFGAIVGAIGLNLLVGTSGQLSLAHAFFLAVGAISYVYVSGESGGIGIVKLGGLGLPPLVGMIVGVLLAGLAGLLFSPIAARLRGIYLGVASLGLVFIGQHLLNTWDTVTGGFNGRAAPKFSLFGFSFSNKDPLLFIANVEFREAERLWYLGLVIALASYWFARNLLRSRSGRALQTLRDSEVAASVMGVNVQRYKGRVFLVSSMYGGLSGVLYALSIGSVAPDIDHIPVLLGWLGTPAGTTRPVTHALVTVVALLTVLAVGTWLAAQPARGNGSLIGRKPEAFCVWMFELLGMVPGDQLDDLFPGTGIVGRCWAELSRHHQATVSVAGRGEER